MFSIWERAGTFAIAAALLFVALRVHRSSGKHSKVTKPAGIIIAFFAGCAFLVTFVGDWMSSTTAAVGGFAVAGLIVCIGVIVVDWLLDGRPDKFAFWSAFALAMFMVVGVAQIPQAGDQIGDGGMQVVDQLGKVGKPSDAPKSGK